MYMYLLTTLVMSIMTGLWLLPYLGSESYTCCATYIFCGSYCTCTYVYTGILRNNLSCAYI